MSKLGKQVNVRKTDARAIGLGTGRQGRFAVKESSLPPTSYSKTLPPSSDLDALADLLVAIGLQVFSQKELATAGLTPTKLRADIRRMLDEPRIASALFVGVGQ